MRPLVLRLHFYAGILIAPFILIAATTGGLYAVAPTIEKVVYQHILTVDDSGTALSLSRQAAAAQSAFPDLTMSGMRPASTSTESTRVYFTDPTVGAEKQRAVFVNPYSGQVLGNEAVWFGYLPLSTWLDGFHRHLQLGEPGRIYSELAASWLWLVALGGLYLWFAKSRKERRRGRAGRLVGVDRTVTGRARTLNWHGATGVWILVMLVFLSATGITWSTYAGANVTDLRAAMGWQRPQLDTALTGTAAGADAHGGHDGHGSPEAATVPITPASIDFSGVVDAAEKAGVALPLEVTLPAEPSQAIGVAEIDKPFRLTTDSAAINPSTLAVTSRVDYNRDYSVVAKLADWGIRLHMGFLFGLLNQLLLLAVVIGLLAVIVRGYRMWWQRRPTRGSDLAVGRPPLRGGIRQVSPVVVILLLAGTVVVGWFLPLLGLSLLGFFVLDLVIGAAKASRSRAARGSMAEIG